MHDRPRNLGLESHQGRNRFRPLRNRRSLLGLGREGSGPQQNERYRARRRSAERRQALHQDADAECRRRRHSRRHHERRERHRDRAVGSLRPHSTDSRLQSARRPLPRSRPFLSHSANRSQRGRHVAVARPGTGGQSRKMELDCLQISGRRRTCPRPIPNSPSQATTPTAAALPKKITGASSKPWKPSAKL